MQIVHLNPGGMIMFSAIPVPDDLRADLEADGAEIVEDVTFPGIPDQGGHLCVSLADPKRFQVFPTREEARAAGFEPLNRPYGLKTSEKQWRSYLKGLKEMIASLSRFDGEDTTTDEEWDSIMANLRRPDYP